MSRAEAIVERLHALHPKLIDLSLGRMERALAMLGHPERRLPPVIHVAGTNGKGSTCAFIRAIAEAAGQRVHVYTSPHLVHFHERVRLAGELVTDEALSAALEEVEALNAGEPITVFEITTAVALLLFSRVPADLLVLEVGLGGIYDATNVVDRPAATAIASISMDHMDFLGDRLDGIAGEKAGIIKPGVPCATGFQDPVAMAVLERVAGEKAAPLLARGRGWRCDLSDGGMRYGDARGVLDLPRPALRGPHQADNAGIAITALRAWGPAWLSDDAIARGVASATWPARMQRLDGALAAMLPAGFELWLDGGHNAGAGVALAEHLAGWRDRPLHLVVGMKKGKASEDFLRPLIPYATTLHAVAEALARIARDGAPGRVLVCGSLYLAGEVLKAEASPPPA